MQIPTQTATQSINTGATASYTGPTGGQGPTLLSEGLRGVSSGLDSYTRQMAELKTFENAQAEKIDSKLQIQKRQDETLEIEKGMSQLRNDWSQRLQQYAENPTEDVLTKAQKEYDDYSNEMVNKASSPDVSDKLRLETAQYRLHLTNEAWRLQVLTRAKNFGADFDQMLGNAEDSIYTTQSLQELNAHKELLNRAIDSAQSTGRIKDAETVQALKSKVDALGVTWAQSVMGTNPQQVLAAVRGEEFYGDILKGVPSNVRYTLEHQAEQSLKTMGEMDKTAIRQAYESDKVQRVRTGQGSAWNYNDHVKAFGKTSADAAQRELNVASRLYDVNQTLGGATNEEIRQIVDNSVPKSDPKSTTYAEEDEFHTAVVKMASQALQDKKNDPYTYFAKDPVIGYLASEYEKHPSIQAKMAVEDSILNAQRRDGAEEYELKIMPKATADKFIQDFNGLMAIRSKSSPNDVRDRLLNFADAYKDHMPIALRQLHDVKDGGEKVSDKLVPLMWHLGNPNVFQAAVESIRKDPKEVDQLFKDTKDKINFFADVNTDPNFQKYAASILNGNNSADAASMVAGVRETFSAYARDQYLAGGRLKDASAQFFSPYSFGSFNGATYARPMTYTDTHTQSTHTVSEAGIKMSNRYLELYPSTINPSTIDPASLLNSYALFNEKERQKDITDALRSNVFWATTEDEAGVYMMTKGSILTAPKQVKTKDGKPIRINFEDTYAPKAMPTFDKKYFRETPPATDDTWIDNMLNSNFGG